MSQRLLFYTCVRLCALYCALRYKQKLEETANMDDSDDDDDDENKKLVGESKDSSAGDLEGGGAKRRKSGAQTAEAVSFGFSRADSLHDSEAGSVDLPMQVQLTKEQVDRLSTKAKLRYLINNALEPEDDVVLLTRPSKYARSYSHFFACAFLIAII